MNMTDRELRMMTDCQRMLWRDDVAGICPTLDMCFEYGDHVRCGPCAIKQAAAYGVETDHRVPNLPVVYRLKRALNKIAENDGDGLHTYTPQAMQAIARDALERDT